MEYKDIINQDKQTRPQHFKYLLHKNKDIIGPFLDPNLDKIDHNNYISDQLKPIDPNKTNILFAGCSITVGCGVNDIKKSWSYKLYNKMSKDNDCSGYFNIGCSGFSPIEIMINILKYIAKYGCPDFIFILFPNWGRDWHKFNTAYEPMNKVENGEILDIFVFNLYSILEDICKTNNAKIFSTSWSDPIPGITDFINIDLQNFETHMNKAMKQSFNSYYDVDKKRFAENVFWFIENINRGLSIIGNDGTHPSEAVHYAWFKEAEFQLKEAINVDNGN
jgi:hypothetical protein